MDAWERLQQALIQYFYEIVNHPPFVQRVIIVQGLMGLEPQDFGSLDLGETVYDAEWIFNGSTARTKQIHTNKVLNPEQQTYIFLQFGPSLPPLGSKTVQAESLSVRFAGLGGLNIDIQMSKAQSRNPGIGTYYWGIMGIVSPFRVLSGGVLQLEIQAKDAAAHLEARSQPGYDLDSNPATVARINALDAPLYRLVDYEPGSDKNHSIEMANSYRSLAMVTWQILEG